MNNAEKKGVLQSPSESMDSLRETNRRQEAALQAKGRLVDNMAYQIRTLSNAIIGFSDLLLTEELTPDQRDYAAEINTAGKGLSELVNEVLDWARLESGRLQITRTHCSLQAILDELEQTARPVALEKKLAFELDWDAQLPTTIVTDSERLLKCLVNLTANAIQYTEEGFVRINVHTETRSGTVYVRFDIADSGPGIAPEKLGSLFEPAMEEADAHAQVVMMLGSKFSAAAGLPLTRQLAELLGGSIEVQSAPGKGSTFSLLLPMDANTVSGPMPHRSESRPTAEDFSPDAVSLPILLVEDQESNRTVIRLMLKTMGYEVDTAEDGQEAVELAISRDYSLIIMDLKMPRMDGFEAACCLRDRQIKMPIVALSAISLNPDEKTRISELFDGFLSKPIDSEQLLAAVRKYAVGAGVKIDAAGIS
jgi:CheY-like chemotaxis protein